MANQPETQTVRQPEPLLKVTVEMPADLHRDAKISAVRKGLDVRDIYAEAMKEYLAAHAA